MEGVFVMSADVEVINVDASALINNERQDMDLFYSFFTGLVFGSGKDVMLLPSNSEVFAFFTIERII